MPRSALRALNRTMIKKEKEIEEEEDSNSSSEEAEPQKKVMLNQTVTYDQKALEKHSAILGLDDKDIKNMLTRPMRTRRSVNNAVLSKRQKKKLMREQKKEKIMLMEKNTKLNISMNPNLANKSTLTLAPSSIKKQKNSEKFNLGELDNEIFNVVDKINEEEGKSAYTISKFRNKKKTALLKESIDLDAYEFVKKGIENFLNPIMKNSFKYTSVIPNGVGNPKKFSSIMYLKDPNLICYKVETKISPNLNKNFTAVEVSLYKKSYEKFSLTGFLAHPAACC